MARRKYPTLSPETMASDVSITIWPDEFCDWRGTAAQLIAEGVMPADFADWPARYDRRGWQSGDFSFSLIRERPPGAKGPRRAFESVDYWRLRIEQKERKYLSGWDKKIRQVQAELQSLREGREFSERRFSLYWRAHQDAKFQSFLDAAIYA